MEFNSIILEIIQRTHDVKSFRLFRHPKFGFKPGQCLRITLTINEKEEGEYYSISSSPTQNEFLEFTQKLTNTKFSNKLDNLKKGDKAKIDGPYGSSTFEGEFQKVAMLAGGVGITPCMSMILFCNDKKIDTNIVVLYSNRTEADILFKNEFDQIEKENPNIKIVYTLTRVNTNWDGYSRRIDKEIILKEIADLSKRIFFLYGPASFVSSMEKILVKLNVNNDNIREEHF